MAKEETLEEKIARLEGEKQAALKGKDAAEQALTKLNKTHETFVKESTDEIGRLSQELDSATSDAAKSILTATVEGKKYQVIGKAYDVPDRGVLSVQEIIKDKKLFSSLVKIGAGFIVPVE